ncbi:MULTISPECIES: hydroxyphenylacetyl-CoA thioesterase PaaI [unclassified Rhodococcus (in: high G+C Gram-positive bacteria)]|uniref:hydroxyphenylacetyl-CoA thioesterase PaaI n=1 Tax=unclassified Rhodococcus (in: high G+C Gram-positive bacteria) TaxID=192944 RepID=UPI00163AFFCB|nr:MULTISPECIES: hydroxyphenylacetyl-CoA thioesterase PaaI [unclassified Rhodococcus (in: high G+C Gram-positive bacteria)]MBC2640352.1 hydroxyphenylacetyl-CoA thioesterase PaaI [Rhodococcus sp. 3A]MBC2894902.1 hydroxyphenylacetyl-CoA thioesterase PaaI [Rhodococcus sp. 4CII]
MTVDASAECRIAREMFEADTASQALGIQILELRPGHAVASMVVGETMVNGHGITHGGFVFTLADTAFAMACNGYDLPAVAARADIRFLASTRLGDTLVAEAVERARYGRNGLYDVTVRRGDDVVAEFRGDSRCLRPVSTH